MENNSDTNHHQNSYLSPEQMHHLVYNLFGPECPLQVKQIEATAFKKIPMFNLCKYVMQDIKANEGIQLTESAAFPSEWVKEIYKQNYFQDQWLKQQNIEPNTESDSESICLTHAVLIASGLCSDAGNKMQLTQLGHTALLNDQLLLETILFNFAMNIDWSALDGYGKHPAAQVGIGVVLMLLHQYGHETHKIKFYSDLYYKAFPSLLGMFPSGLKISQEELALRCFTIRCVERFLLMFGMVDVKDESLQFVHAITEIRQQ
ncbi:MAG TPA: hypothetical protein VGF79_08015 [Bacteroidia bacterium]